MKKKVILIALVLLIVSLSFVIKLIGGSRTIEEAINTSVSNKVSIIHEEKHGKRSIVFSYVSGGNGLYTAVVRKDVMGYKTVYSGVQGDIKLGSEKFGISHAYFPNIEKIGLPIYFGVIGKPEINEIRIVEKKREIERKAKIIESKGSRIWLVYMNGIEGSDFDITGYSKEGNELIKINGSISPYYVEQKPLKGYK
jgi:hypothetical protein